VAAPLSGRRGTVCLHWTIRLTINGAIPPDELTEAIDASYDMVVAKLPKRERPV
jgi:predicted DNA-binding protein (MmcQ/YjbR family)